MSENLIIHNSLIRREIRKELKNASAAKQQLKFLDLYACIIQSPLMCGLYLSALDWARYLVTAEKIISG